MRPGRHVRALAMAGLVLGPGALVACGGSSYIGGAPVTTVASVTSGTLEVRTVKGYGKILVSSSGLSLYLLTSDPPGGSTCTGSCSIVWPPLVAGNRLKAGPGVDPSLVSTFTRSDGARQVLYDRHALYTYEEDADPGMVTGQGVQTYGGIWWLVSPSGRAITS